MTGVATMTSARLAISARHRTIPRPVVVAAVGGLAAGFAELAGELSAAADSSETASLVTGFALHATGADYAGIVLVHRGGLRTTVGATDRRVKQADLLQLGIQDGPCVPVGNQEASVKVDDTLADRRWPRWSPRVAELGLRSVLTVGLFTGRSRLGALTLYGSVPGRFTPVDEVTVRLLAVHASAAIAAIQRAVSLGQAVQARGLIGQAQGLLMERFALDAEQSFAVLRRYSQDNNIKLHTVAAQLISTRQLPVRDRPGGASRSAAPVPR